MFKILIVEDDRGIAEGIQSLLEQWGMEARQVQDFRNITGEFETYQPHLILLDIKLPSYDGYYWCGQLRQRTAAPIIFISSAADNMNIVMAMNMGGDDFIAKPFDGSVLVAKVQAMLRRSYRLETALPAPECRGAVLNTADQTLQYEGNAIDLTKNEYRILLCLMERKGQVVSRELLMQRLWETDSFVDENTLTVNVNRLRKKLDWAYDRIRPLRRTDPAAQAMLERANPRAGRTAAYLRDFAAYPVYSGTNVKFYASGEAVFPDLLEALESAQESILLEFFIISKGKMWDAVHHVLRRKAAQGVDVRMIYDDVGCATGLPAQYWKTLQVEGIQAVPFNPFVPLLNLVMNMLRQENQLYIHQEIQFSRLHVMKMLCR